MAGRIKLPVSLTEELVDFLRRERLCEVTSTSTALQRFYALTDLGRERAQDYLNQSQYAGPAPVTLDAYQARVRSQSIADLIVRREDMNRAFSGIVVSASTLDCLGAAMNSGRAIFLYGPAGAGKSFLAEHLVGLLDDDVYIPHAILMRDHLVRVFDPDTHVAADADAAVSSAPHKAVHGDTRWVKCRRPVVITGGELTLDMLDLQFERNARFYAAPAQLKANNGLLIIDDLGRQKVSPQELMNRWIVPLDRKLDYLALHTGEKCMVPFDVTVVFCTNIAPADLADEAFLRRLGYKIHLGALDEAQYRGVCEQVCQTLHIARNPAAIDRLIARFRGEKRPLLACTPRDLLCQVRDRARYDGAHVELNDDLIDWAWNNYFVSRDTEQFPFGQ
jgi:predicted ATPase with chaperone activity